jgi:PAS domain S-box-containing protein
MNDTSIRDDGGVEQTLQKDDQVEQIQLLVSESGDRNALEKLLAERYEVVIEDTLQPVDCYLIGDRMLRAYRKKLQTRKKEARPAFCPVLVIQRETTSVSVDLLFRDEDKEPALIDDVISAPVGREVLYRRLDNLCIRRQQSLSLAQRYEQTKTRFQRLFESTNDAIFVINPVEDTIVECNPKASELVGYSRDELLGLTPSETLHSHERDVYKSFLSQVLETGEGWTDALRCKTKEGDIRQLEVSGSTLQDESTDQPAVIFSARDVTDRVEYRKELEWKTNAIETAPVGVLITDPHQEDNPIIYANKGFRDLTGYPKSEVKGQNCRFLQGEETRSEPVAEMREAIDAHEPVTVELRNYRKDGSQFWNRVTIAPVKNEAGDTTHFVGFQEDISERKEYEQDLELFRRAVEQAGHGVMITDRDGTIKYVNPMYAQDTGYSREMLVGSNPAIVKSGKQDEAFYEELWETILSGEIWEADMINQRRSGELYEVDLTIAPITDETGEITHFVGIESDVTEQRLREQQLDVFNRILRHNIRNMMNVVTGQTTLLQDRIEDKKAQSQLQTIEEQATSLIELGEKARTIRGLLERDGEMNRFCNVAEMLSDLASEFEEAYPDAEITVIPPNDNFVRADDRLAEAIREAVNNAVMHNDKSTAEVTVTVEVPERHGQAEMVDIIITDNGPGIGEKERAIIERGEETPLKHGTGIGLSLIHWVTRRFGGEVRISENEPHGSRVTICVPAASAPRENT